jgi:type I restriction enzyme S subunit
MTELSEGWELSSLGKECDLYQPKTITRSRMKADGLYDVYGANGVIGKFDKYNHEDSEVLLSCRGNCGTVNVSKPRSWINGNAMVIRPKSSNLSKSYLRYYLESVDFAKVITGTAQQQITREPLSKVSIAFPLINEQQRIIEILEGHFSRLDAAMSNLKKAEAESSILLASLFHDLVVSETKERQGSKFLTEITLQRGFDLPKQNRLAGTFPIIASNGEVGSHKTAKVKGPGVVTGRSGTIGKVHYLTSDFWPLNTTLYVKDFHGNDPEFIRYYLISIHLERYAGGSTVPSLDRNVLSDLEVRLPSVEKQLIIVKRMKEAEMKVGELSELFRSVFSSSNLLRRSLLQAAFTGQLTKGVVSV